MKCPKCKDECGSECVVCGACSASFHYNCSVRETKWRNWSVEQRSRWTCVECKAGVNTTSRPSSVASGQSEELTPQAEEELGTAAVLRQICAKLGTLDEVKATVDSIKSSMEFLSARYDELLLEVTGYREENKQLRDEVGMLKQQCSSRGEELDLLTKRFNALEQYGRGVNMEIHGLEDGQGEESSEWVLQHVAQSLGLDYNPAEIQAAHRLPSRNTQRPAVFLVQFVRKAVRERWMRAGRRARLRSKDVVGTGEQRVYFNENLTPFYSRLFMETKKRAREKSYESVWIMNGHIRVKKTRDARQTFTISSLDDLKLLV